jgi:hypothetical protein
MMATTINRQRTDNFHAYSDEGKKRKSTRKSQGSWRLCCLDYKKENTHGKKIKYHSMVTELVQ